MNNYYHMTVFTRKEEVLTSDFEGFPLVVLLVTVVVVHVVIDVPMDDEGVVTLACVSLMPHGEEVEVCLVSWIGLFKQSLSPIWNINSCGHSNSKA